MARHTEGVITIVQESRFQLIDDSGVGHLFTLAHACGVEPGQLAQLHRQRVCVRYKPALNMIGGVAQSIWMA